MNSTRVVVAMSGGVDSGVAAALLQRDGYEVIGVTLRLKTLDAASHATDPATAALAVADHLGIPLHILDRAQWFRDVVLRPSWEEYARGRTPNPCAICNPAVKFDALLDVARDVGSDWIATGHYARVLREPRAAPVLLRARDRTKDQSYFLFALTGDQLARVIFPLGDLSKTEVRSLARDLRLPCAGCAESQDACVVGLGEKLPEFLRTVFDEPGRPGAVVSANGSRLGTHDGFHRFTVGQRRGLGIALGAPAWVKGIDPHTGAITVTTDRGDLLAAGLAASGMIWHATRHGRASFSCLAQVRYGHRPVRAEVRHAGEDGAVLRFDTPVPAVTPGQAVVLYDADTVIGGGWIQRAIPLSRGD